MRKVRGILVGTALVSSILGAIVVYLVLSVPNDLKAGALLKQARAHIAEGRKAEAHDTLTEIIQRFPRTDAAAAATVALVKLEEQERQRMQAALSSLESSQQQQAKIVSDLEKSVAALRAPPPAATAAPAATPAPAAVRKTPAKKTTAKAPAKKTPTKKPSTKRKKR